MNSISDQQVWADMRERLMKLTLKQLKQLAKDEQISLGYDASRKDTCVGAIVSARRHRTKEMGADPATHPWRRWGSLNAIPIKHQTNVYY